MSSSVKGNGRVMFPLMQPDRHQGKEDKQNISIWA